MALEDKLRSYPKEYNLSRYSTIEILINNAGVLLNKPFLGLNREDIETSYSVNKSQFDYLINNGDLDFAIVVDGQRFRANGYYSSYGPSMVLRKIVTEIPDINKLGLPEAAHVAILTRQVWF